MAPRKRAKEPSPQVFEEPSEEEAPSDELLKELSLDGSDADDEGEQGGSENAEDVEVEEESEEDGAIREAMMEYMQAAAQPRGGRDTSGSEGEDGDQDQEAGPRDPGSDSSEDERPNRNTVGNVPLVWYKDEDHIGYDLEGKKLIKAQRKDKLQQLLDRNDSKKALRTIYDPYNDEEITLSKEELAMIMRIRKGQFPSMDINPFEPYNDYFSSEREVMPIVDHPEPKSRFVPSKWEEKKIVKLVRAIRKGWLKTGPKAEDKDQEPSIYLMWGDDGMTSGADKTGAGLTYIPATKPQLPGHAESYNPPAEYLPTEEERAAWELADPEDRPKALPQAYTSLRLVPAYKDFIQERFERCLDLYLCPRVRRKRLDIKAEDLVPQLPQPRDLQPFPTTLALRFKGHSGKVTCVAPDPWAGQWLLSGGSDGLLRLWEVRSGRCVRSWDLGAPITCAAWCPAPGLRLVSALVDTRVVLLPSGTGTPEVEEAAEKALEGAVASGSGRPEEGALATWAKRAGPGGGAVVTARFPLRHLTWHVRGDYFATVAPTGNTQAVLVHQLSKAVSQNPFRKNRGRVMRVQFHPVKPFFFVATQNHVRIYNLAKQELAKKLLCSSGGQVTCMAVHPSGDHVLVGSDDRRLAWYDLDLSNKPYKALRYHAHALRGCAYHRSYPLFASCSDDAAVHVFHGMVYSDLLTNPLIVPVKILKGHVRTDLEGVLDCAFHPTQPWLFTAGADGDICLFCN